MAPHTSALHYHGLFVSTTNIRAQSSYRAPEEGRKKLTTILLEG